MSRFGSAPAGLYARLPSGTVVSIAPGGAGQFFPQNGGKWIVYQTFPSAEGSDIYIQPFPGDRSQRRKVSIGGGNSPRWSRDGRELYFLSPDNYLMVAAVRVSANGTDIEVDEARRLFDAPLPDGATFAPAADGRFLVHEPSLSALPITFLQKWPRATGNRPDASTEPAVVPGSRDQEQPEKPHPAR